MSNMSYCMFENTARDLADCVSVLYDEGSVHNYIKETEPSEFEVGGMTKLFELAEELLEYKADAQAIYEALQEEYDEDA